MVLTLGRHGRLQLERDRDGVVNTKSRGDLTRLVCGFEKGDQPAATLGRWQIIVVIHAAEDKEKTGRGNEAASRQDPVQV